MTTVDAESIVESKCATEGCWHYSWGGHIYCVCCLYEKCNSMDLEARVEYQAAKKFLKEKSNG